MTTLPQTTTIRLPRPAGGGQLVAGHSGITNVTAVGGMTGADVWRVVRANMWVILLFLVVGMVVGYLGNQVLAKYYARYTASGYIQINSASSFLPGVSQASDPVTVNIELKTQASLLRTESLVSRLIQQPDESPNTIRGTAWFQRFRTPDDAKADFVSDLEVLPVPDTKLIKVSITAPYGADAKTILEAFINLHIKEQGEAATSNLTNERANLVHQKTRAEGQLRDKDDAIKDDQNKLQGDGGMGINRLSFKEIELSQIVSRINEIQGEIESIQAKADSLKAELNNGRDPIEVTERVENDPDIRNYRNIIDNLELDRMTQEQRYGKNNQFIDATNQKITVIQKKLDDKTAQVQAMSRMQLQGGIEQQLATLQDELTKAQSTKTSLQSDMGELAAATSDLNFREEDEKFQRDKIKDINSQIDNVDNLLSQQAANKVSWMSRPEVPANPSFPKLQYTMTVAVLLALALSLGVALLREALDQTVRSPRDIAKVGQMNLLGMVPDESDDPQSAGARLPLVIFDAPHSIMAEQFRQVRTKLQHAASLDTTRSMMITSPAPGDGKTTVAANLAAGLALNGRRILLVDANFRRPEIHKIFGFHNEQGFSDVLNGTVDFEEMAQETQVPNLAVMTSGPKPVNATELFESQLLIDFIERALEEYDHVIFDSGPMLVVSESVAMAPRVDGVVTVVRARSNSRGLLTRMRDSLRQIKAEHLGVVLNAVKSQGGGYYGRNIRTYYEYENV